MKFPRRPRHETFLVSIANSVREDGNPPLPTQYCKGIARSSLRFQFDDVDPSQALPGMMVLNAAQAYEIINHFRAFRDIFYAYAKPTQVLIQCESGISRSSALALFLIDSFLDGNETIKHNFFHENPQVVPNSWIYHFLIHEYKRMVIDYAK